MKRPCIISLVGLVGFLLFDIVVLSSHNWDPHAFIMERRPEVPLEQGWDIGYDAQWYYAIAADPSSAASQLDAAAYRYQRILYPLLIRLVSLGKVSWMPWAMVLINLIAAGVFTYLVSELLSKKGAPFWYAWIITGSIGFLIAMRMDLLEPLTFALALAGWKFFDEDKLTLSVVCFALAGLTKEVGLSFPAALVIWLLIKKRWGRAGWIAFGSFLPYFAWQVYLSHTLGNTAFQAEATRPGLIPFSGLFAIQDAPSRMMLGLWAVLPAIIGALLLSLDLWRKPSAFETPEAFLVLVQILLIAFLPHLTWVDPLAVLRSGIGLLAALLLWLAGSHRRVMPYLGALFIPSGIVLAMVPGFFR
jgi:hypothetical protein